MFSGRDFYQHLTANKKTVSIRTAMMTNHRKLVLQQHLKFTKKERN